MSLSLRSPSICINLLSRDIARAAEFYRSLCGLEPVHEESWYVVLAASPESSFQLGLIDWVSEFVPRAARGDAQGAYLEIVVEDVVAALSAIRDFDIFVIEEPVASGDQARAILRDPDGHVIDLCTARSRYSLPPNKAVG